MALRAYDVVETTGTTAQPPLSTRLATIVAFPATVQRDRVARERATWMLVGLSVMAVPLMACIAVLEVVR